MDRHCLEQGKRCVMWDDQGAGFYLVRRGDGCCVAAQTAAAATELNSTSAPSCPAPPSTRQLLNWDWVANRPTAPPSIQDAVQPGWWFNARQVLKAPLIDPDLPEASGMCVGVLAPSASLAH